MHHDKSYYLNTSGQNVPLQNPVSPATENKVRHYRLERVRQQLRSSGTTAILLYDPVNIRYATDASNMTIWTTHTPCRYLLVVADGPVILWEFHNCSHLVEHLPTIDDIRTAIDWTYFGAGDRAGEKVVLWAQDLSETLQDLGLANEILAVDKLEPVGVFQLQQQGIRITSGQSLMETARAIKSQEELSLIQWTVEVCDKAIARMYREMTPGMTERELWAYLHFENIRHGGEWIETRLLSSGPRTNPWMQECGHRVMEKGDMMAFDTDMIGPYGYCADISRTWTVGHTTPTASQRHLYQQAYEQIQHNISLIRADRTFEDFTRQAWPIPKHYHKNKYGCTIHGVGMADEYPYLCHLSDWDRNGFDGRLQENMVVCVESYIGEEGGIEGVKLEEMVVITRDGCRPLSKTPFEQHWF
ncbi:M24 family metallopeptidase [Hahella ganghwensis]|uniref:M24 family metallopeptidase n=1 Tax=Hahella ganghwensis TaxID=286420 RepID=UPI000372339E|nr:Xaa-Pro peptidase family protein [Hahella ganghwensis]